jgi:Ferritin-like domain
VVDRPRRECRRSFLTGGAAAAGVAWLSGCGSGGPLREKVRSGAKVARVDVEPLNTLLDVEYYAIAAYAAGIPLLHEPQSTAAMQFLGQEMAHSVQLQDLIGQTGETPHRPKVSYELGHPRAADEVLALLQRVEKTQLRVYLDVLPRLSGGKVRSAVVSIFANEAQHLGMLRWETGQAPVPAALVTGS